MIICVHVYSVIKFSMKFMALLYGYSVLIDTCMSVLEGLTSTNQ